jgi:hypothetical protein
MSTGTPNLRQIVLDCRRRISEAFALRGDSHALAALACSSITLQFYVEAGSLRQDILDELAETANNLGLSSRLGADVVDIAADCGPMLFDAIEQALFGPAPSVSVPPAHPLAAKINGEFNKKMAPGGAIDRAMAGRGRSVAKVAA